MWNAVYLTLWEIRWSCIRAAVMTNRCQVQCSKSSICTSNLKRPVICVNYCIQCLQGFLFSDYGMRIHSTVCHVWCFVHWPKRSHAAKTTPTMWPISHRFFCVFVNNKFQVLRSKCNWDQTTKKRERESGGGSRVLFLKPRCGSYPGTFATSLLHTAAVMVPPGQDCVLCSVRCGNHPRTAGRNILAHTADIHLDLDTAGSDLSPLLNNNMVDHNHSTWLSS